MTRIVQIVNSTAGGAGIATVRLNNGLRKLGYDSTIVCQQNDRNAQATLEVRPAPFDNTEDKADVDAWKDLEKRAILNNRTSVCNTLFSLGYPGMDLTQIEEVRQADIIHMHWVPRVMSVRTIDKLLSLGKPTFWTMHDYWPVTPGNHFPAGQTEHFGDGAGAAHLAKDNGLGHLLLRDKAASFDHNNLHVIALSRKMKQDLQATTVFRNRQISVWYNAVETDVFQPLEAPVRLEVRRQLGVPDGALMLLVVAQNISEKRKGFALLIQAINRLVSKMGESNRRHVCVCMIGAHALPAPSSQMSVIQLDTIKDRKFLATLFGSSDFLVHPATEEGFSLVILEAMAAGLPVISFDNGGSPDLIETGKNGVLIEGRPEISPLVEVLAAANAISEQDHAVLRQGARASAENYSLDKVAANMVDIYREEVPGLAPTLSGSVELDEEIMELIPTKRKLLPLDPRPSDWLAAQDFPKELAG